MLTLVLALGLQPVALEGATRDLYEDSKAALKACKKGDDPACSEMLQMAREGLRHEDVAVRWKFAKVVLDGCEAKWGPACDLAAKVGQGFVRGDTVDDLKRGVKLLIRVCKYDPKRGCRVAADVGHDLMKAREGTADYKKGRDLLAAACEHGALREACRDAGVEREPEPEAPPVEAPSRVGSVLSYVGLGIGTLGALTFGGAYEGRHRCETGPKGTGERAVENGCRLSWIMYAAGHVTSIIGTKLYLSSRARVESGDPDITGTSLWWWLGMGGVTLGAVVPAVVAATPDKPKGIIGWSPFVLSLLGQTALFVARQVGPTGASPVALQVVPLEDRHGHLSPGLGIGARWE